MIPFIHVAGDEVFMNWLRSIRTPGEKPVGLKRNEDVVARNMFFLPHGFGQTKPTEKNLPQEVSTKNVNLLGM